MSLPDQMHNPAVMAGLLLVPAQASEQLVRPLAGM